MPANYQQLVSLKAQGVPYSYAERDTQLYALSIGMGRDPLNRDELQYVFESIACREILAAACNYDNTLIKSFSARFTSVVYPGERIETQIWIDDGVVSFRCRVPEREVVVLDHGECVLASHWSSGAKSAER